MSTVATEAPPTARQLEILAFIVAYRDANGLSPTVREIGEAMSIKSPNGVMCHTRALVTKGLLRSHGRWKSRGFIPVAPATSEGGRCPTCGRPRETDHAAATE
jgi:SOS-response transcriptional repressor LexA